MRVMVLGATGFIGPAVTTALEYGGHEPVAVSRAGPVAADRDDPAAIARLAAAHRAEAVVDLLALTLRATAPLLAALSGRVGRYVLASSGDVYRQYGVLHRKEAGGGRAGPLDEEAPLRARLHPYRAEPRRAADDPAAWMDDYDKIPIEAAIRAGNGVVVRLPMVYGPRDRQRRFAWAIRPMAAGAPVIDVDPPRWAAWRTTYGYVDDVGHGLALAATHPSAAGRTYNLGEADPPDHAGWIQRFASALGWAGEVRNTAGPRLDGMDLSRPFVMDTHRIRRELGYAEPTARHEALDRTIDDELSRAS